MPLFAELKQIVLNLITRKMLKGNFMTEVYLDHSNTPSHGLDDSLYLPAVIPPKINQNLF